MERKEIDLQIYKAMETLLLAINHCDVTKGTIAMLVHEKIESLQTDLDPRNKSNF